jgi:hypothetical protein
LLYLLDNFTPGCLALFWGDGRLHQNHSLVFFPQRHFDTFQRHTDHQGVMVFGATFVQEEGQQIP